MNIPDSYRGREQSYVKHHFLRQYLERVLFVTQSPSSRFSEFVYVDGFSGPWKSQTENYSDTSFAIAIEQLRLVREKYKSLGHVVKMRCCFVEQSSAFNELQIAVSQITDIEIRIFNGRFENLIPKILEWIGRSPSTFVLTFVDPTGWSVDLAAIAPLLARKPGEVIYNFMYSFLRRFPTHPDPNVRLSYELPLGKGWQAKLDPALSFDDSVISLFTQELKKAGKFEHVLKITVLKPTTDAPHFYLFYGTRHRKGVIEFRKAQRSTSATQAAVRHEARALRREVRTGQDDLFRTAGLDDPLDDQVERQRELDMALIALRRFVANSRVVRFERVVDHLLVNYEITEREVQSLLDAERVAGRIQIEGMSLRERLPKNGYLIRATSP